MDNVPQMLLAAKQQVSGCSKPLFFLYFQKSVLIYKILFGFEERLFPFSWYISNWGFFCVLKVNYRANPKGISC